MPLISEGHDALTYIDPTEDSSRLDQARAAIAAELSEPQSNGTPSLHSLIPDTEYDPDFGAVVAAAHNSIARTGKARPDGEGISLDRYEEPDAPTSAEDLGQWRSTVQAAYTSHSYLRQRALNLSLLEKYGKNAWLISNAQVEDELRTLERELKAAKEEGFALDDERKRKQESIKGELEALQQSWQESLGRAIEAEVAGSQLQQQILDARRAAANTGAGSGSGSGSGA